MRIRKIKFENHPVLGTLELDFTDKQGKTVNTIIIAGENGVGKSLILNSIFEFSNYTFDSRKRNEKSSFEIEFNDREIDIFQYNNNFKQYFTKPIRANILNVDINNNINDNWSQRVISAITTDGEDVKIPGQFFTDGENKKPLKTIFSDVEINFTPNAINSVTSKNIDIADIQSEKSNSNLASDITQLLIDIQSIDALEFNDWARKNTGTLIDPGKIDIRMRRFTSAFEFMFPTKRYNRIDTIDNHKKVIFEENGKEMGIENLSSGEKQIVFRGSFLLQNKESSKCAVILIDEPEISLHPSWQLKILNFFKKLFTNNAGEQTSQIIIATHSPFIIHNANRNEDKVVVLQKDVSGKVVVSNAPKFYAWSPEKLIQEAFNVSQIFNTEKNIVFVEGETDEEYLKKSFEIFQHQEKVEFKWIGRINENGSAENTGDTALNQAGMFFRANPQILKTKTILFYDSDTMKPDETFGLLLIRRMSINDENYLFEIGIENLLTLPVDFDKNRFYKEKVKKDRYGAETITKKLDKTLLCSYICNELQVDIQKEILKKINEEIKRLVLELGVG
ncbi:hypothetical protein AGMMS49991_10040 [Spirochaetia bacterium]|nr:hypothetical protein AGMMS49991_10040 [Spirochaetia bacterium]